MAENLTPEEQARLERLDALGAPSDATANIKWSGGKEKKISRRTWVTKNRETRLARARLDLLDAGYEEDARVLTTTRLNTAWQKLDQKMKGDYLAERSQAAAQEPAEKKKRLRRKDGDLFFFFSFFFPFLFFSSETSLSANRNLEIARSIGVRSALDEPEFGNPAIEGGDDPARDVVHGFSIDCELVDGESDPRTERLPLMGAIMVEANEYDPDASSVLIVRISAAGLNSRVEKPRKVSERTMDFRVVRNNKSDVASWLHAASSDVTEADLAEYRDNVGIMQQKKFGNHMGYTVLNTAFQALVPAVEEWVVTVSVLPPYMIGEVNDVIFLGDKLSIDVLASIPLTKDVPNVDKDPVIMLAK